MCNNLMSFGFGDMPQGSPFERTRVAFDNSYDGEAEGNGEFIELQGTVWRCSYTTHDYEIEVSGSKYHNVLLDVLDGQIRIHVPSTYKSGANSSWRREIDYYYRPVVDK